MAPDTSLPPSLDPAEARIALRLLLLLDAGTEILDDLTEPEPETDAEHDARLDDGWALWEGGPEHVRGIWPDDKIGLTEHAHCHREGPFFNHKHPGGAEPHDHAPGDRLLPKWTREV